MDDTLDLVRSMRDSIRDFNCRAEQQNASIRSTFSGGFICPMPVGDDSQEGETEVESKTQICSVESVQIR
jgi:hypothetical protein